MARFPPAWQRCERGKSQCQQCPNLPGVCRCPSTRSCASSPGPFPRGISPAGPSSADWMRISIFSCFSFVPPSWYSTFPALWTENCADSPGHQVENGSGFVLDVVRWCWGTACNLQMLGADRADTWARSQSCCHLPRAAVTSPVCSGSVCQAPTVAPTIPVLTKVSEKVEVGFMWAGRATQEVFLLTFAPLCWCKPKVPRGFFLLKNFFWDY